MAEFQEVIGQFKRLCDSANQNCSNCGLKDVSCSVKDITENPLEFEKRVMDWATDHPEPVYPTWYEYLTDMYSAIWNTIRDKPIPADIAEKLAIDPVPIIHADCGATSAEEARKKLGIEPNEVNGNEEQAEECADL